MKVHLKKLQDQVIVITGASSGLGLITARKAVERGAKVVLIARNGAALSEVAESMRAQGGEVLDIVADVANDQAMRDAAQQAIDRFGGFDTWINNAGVSIFGKYDEVPIEDHRRLFETNFWGVVNGSLAAAPTLKKRGGALINLGSEVSEYGIPLQGMYSASKHAIKGFTDSLRMEWESEQAPVSITLIKPAGLDTMFIAHAKNFMDVEPKLPPPVYAPDIAAEAILFAAQNPRRDLYVGGAAAAFALSAKLAPRLTDWIMERFIINQQRSDQPTRGVEDNALYQPQTAPILSGRERQGIPNFVRETSLYTAATTHPKTAGAILGGIALAALMMMNKPSRVG